jgi:hypothetical protein
MAEIVKEIRTKLRDLAKAAKQYSDPAVYGAVMSGTYFDMTHALERAQCELTAHEEDALRVSSEPDAGDDCLQVLEQIRQRKAAFGLLLEDLRTLRGRLKEQGSDIDILLSMRPTDVEW